MVVATNSTTSDFPSFSVPRRGGPRPTRSRSSATCLSSLPANVLMDRFVRHPSERDPILAELQARYSATLDSFLRVRKGVRCPGHRDDIIQNVWFKLWRLASTHNGWKPLKAESRNGSRDSVRAFLRKTAENLLIDQFRRGRTAAKYLPRGSFDVGMLTAGQASRGLELRGAFRTETSVERQPRGPRGDLLAGKSRRERVRLEKRALERFGSLPARDQTMLLLAAEGHTTREIGQKMQHNPGGVSLHLTAARQWVMGNDDDGNHPSETPPRQSSRHRPDDSPASRVPGDVDRAIAPSDRDGGGYVAV